MIDVAGGILVAKLEETTTVQADDAELIMRAGMCHHNLMLTVFTSQRCMC